MRYKNQTVNQNNHEDPPLKCHKTGKEFYEEKTQIALVT